MKKLFVFTLVFALLSVFAVSANAEESVIRLIDSADILTSSEEAEVSQRLDEVSEEYGFDVVVWTVDSIGVYSADLYAEEFFEAGNYGEGVILLVSMEDRDWGMYSTDIGDDDLYDIGDSIVSDLSDGDYKDAFMEFADEIADYMAFPWMTALLGSVIAGLIIALIATSAMKGKLKSVQYRDHAREYVRAGSFALNRSRDAYLYSTVHRVARPKNTSSGARSGGSRGGGGRARGKF